MNKILKEELVDREDQTIINSMPFNSAAFIVD